MNETNGGTMQNSGFRSQLFTDVLAGKMPARVPESCGVNACAALELAGFDLRTAQYGYTKVLEAAEQLNAKYDTDTLIGTWPAMPYVTKAIGSRTNVMGADGFMQHPNVHIMEATEYDELIADPLKYMWDKQMPRAFTEFAEPWPNNAFALLKAMLLEKEVGMKMFMANYEMSIKYNKSTTPIITAISRAPFDYLADYFRSFTGALTDIRRYPNKVLQAVETLKPLMVRGALASTAGAEPTREGNRVFFALHMATYMRPKDFQKYWWPTFKETIWDVYNAGFGILIFAEENWMQLIDCFDELPPLCHIMFEYGDPKIIKEKVGKKHIIQGMYPVDLLKRGSKEEVTAKAKELLDVMAPGGQYIFDFDKSILRAKQVNWDNFGYLVDCVKEYGKY